LVQKNDEKNRASQVSRTRNNTSHQRAASMAKIYLTDIDHERDFFGMHHQETFGVLPDGVRVIDDKGKKPNLSKILPSKLRNRNVL
jgi:hypothetical protein